MVVPFPFTILCRGTAPIEAVDGSIYEASCFRRATFVFNMTIIIRELQTLSYLNVASRLMNYLVDLCDWDYCYITLLRIQFEHICS